MRLRTENRLVRARLGRESHSGGGRGEFKKTKSRGKKMEKSY